MSRCQEIIKFRPFLFPKKILGSLSIGHLINAKRTNFKIIILKIYKLDLNTIEKYMISNIDVNLLGNWSIYTY